MTEDWVPFGLSVEESDRYRVLVDGVPRKLRQPIISWMGSNLKDSYYDNVIVDKTRHLELLTDLPVGVPDGYLTWASYAARVLQEMDGQGLLRVTDAILATRWPNASVAQELERNLALAKSKWTVGDRNGVRGLVSREPEGVQDAVEGAISSSGTAGRILARAWGKVHGLEPDDSGAYADAVKAVEIAAQPLIEPRNDEATLGGMAGVMRNHGDWALPLRAHDHAPANDLLVAMCRTLYRGHVDRHGRDDYRDVTHEEARAGVILAATLVSWFASGAVQRRP